MITCGAGKAALDYAIMNREGLIAASFFDRSLMSLKAMTASLSAERICMAGTTYASTKNLYQSYFTPVIYGKEKFYHGYTVMNGLNQTYFISDEEHAAEDYYSFLMHNFDLPLLKEWGGELLNGALKNRFLDATTTILYGSYSPNKNSGKVNHKKVYSSFLTEELLKDLVKELFAYGRICITEHPQKKLNFTNMDGYFKNYGYTLVKNLKKEIQPLTELSGNIDSLVFRQMRLYPQQAAQVNGLMESLKHSNYGILNLSMGTGKTIISTAIAEGMMVRKYMDQGHTLKEAYMDPDAVSYRNIVMCPGHLVRKWEHEIKSEVPYAKVTVIQDFSQLVEIRKAGRERKGKEWFIIGKDFAKLSYQSVPVPTRVQRKRIVLRECTSCSTVSNDTRGGDFLCTCGCRTYRKYESYNSGKGMVCPSCGEVLLKNGLFQEEREDGTGKMLLPSDFATPNTRNARCSYCGSELWRPFVRNINTKGTDFYEHANRNSRWIRATHYANKTHKSKKTVWVHKDFKKEYFDGIGEKPLAQKEEKGVRRYAPAAYIKKYLKGYLDFFILDEAHLFKGGATAQGNAMQALVCASKKQIALTGTIAGGMATHLFYLLYRLDPGRMKAHGFEFSNEMEFARKYGTVETLFEASGDVEGNMNLTSKGRQIASPKVKPGISPLIFSDFLLDKTVYLDLSDMSKFLPAFKEYVIPVSVPEVIETENGDVVENPEIDMLHEYRHIINVLKERARSGEGRGVLSKMLQFSLSYPDHPYGVTEILSPNDGTILAIPKNFDQFRKKETLLSKEKKLVEIVKRELGEKRNCVIYAEFTGSPETCVTYRLKDILMHHCGLADAEVTVIESSSPEAAKREAFLHKKAEEGTRVFIVQPRCVETGLDFCWKNKDGKLYNYPTLIFYQLGYSLFTVWQASRRSYRLNQRVECRNYYMAYAGTVQEAVIQLIAEKQVATSAIQGKFSTEGLSAMAQGIDERVRLAEAMSDMDSINGAGLQDMFDVLNQEENADLTDGYANYEPMKIYKEIVGDVEILVEKTLGVEAQENTDTMVDMFNFMNFMEVFEEEKNRISDTPDEKEELLTEMKFSFLYDQEEEREASDLSELKKELEKSKRYREKARNGQMSLFSMIGG